MTKAARAAWGAVLGASFTLLLHPVSRSYIFSSFIQYRSSSFEAWNSRLPSEKVKLAFSMAGFCNQLMADRDSVKGIDRAVSAAERGLRLDSENAYWEQLLAAFYARKGQKDLALQHWFSAAKKISWNDYQSSFLVAQRFESAAQFGTPQSWQIAHLYYLRSTAPAEMISAYGRSLVNTAGSHDPRNLVIRAVTVKNGDMLREFARSVKVGNYGAQLEELASHPPGLSTTSNHKMLLARLDLFNKLNELGRNDLATVVNRSYHELDAWDAYLTPSRIDEEVQPLTLKSVLAATIPGASLILLLLGGILAAAGKLMANARTLKPYAVGVLGLFIAIAAYMVSGLYLVSLASLGCCLMLVYSPKTERTQQDADLGPLFAFLAGLITFIFAIVVTSFTVTSSFPATSLLPNVGVPPEYVGGSGALFALGLLFASILLFVAPMYALALRYRTSSILKVLLRKSGINLLAFGSIGMIVLTPLAIALDRQNTEPLQEMLLNEPNHMYRELNR